MNSPHHHAITKWFYDCSVDFHKNLAITYVEELIFQVSPNVFICASSFNSGALNLYQRMGYEVIGEIRDYIIKGHNEVFMRKTIGPLHDFKPEKPVIA